MRLAWVVLVLGCSPYEAKHRPGQGRDLNSDCAAPLVCSLEARRIQCSSARDCSPGADCVFDEGGFGVCQLPRELSCDRDSECPDPLRCRFRACVNECSADRDCPPGASCTSPDA